MLAKFILVIILNYGNPNDSIIMQEFDSQKNCETAASFVYDARSKISKIPKVPVVAICTPK